MTRKTTSGTMPRGPSSSVIVIVLAVSAALTVLRALDRSYERYKEKDRAYNYSHDSRSHKSRSHRARSRSRSRLARRSTDCGDYDRHYDERRARTIRRASAPVIPSSYSEVNFDLYDDEPVRYITDGREMSKSRPQQVAWNDDERTLINDPDLGSDTRVVLYRDENDRGRDYSRREYVHRDRYERRR